MNIFMGNNYSSELYLQTKKTNLMKTPILITLFSHSMQAVVLAFSIMLASAAFNFAQAQNPARGERPPIDIASVPSNAVEPGIIRIKFNQSAEQRLEQSNPILNASEFVEFGIPEIDALNQQFGVASAKQTFEIALRNTKYTERHRQWGFHLWYDLILPENVNFRTAVQAYAAQEKIEFSEPVYKKELVNNDARPIPFEPSPDNGNIALNYTPNDPQYNQQWHYHNTGQQAGTVDADIDLPEAWEITKGNNQVVVAIIDQGVEYTHNDLAGNMWPGNGYNFVNDNSTIIPGNHGTHVGGTVAANTNNSIGVSGIAGGNGSGNGVRLMSCQVFIENGSSGGFEDAPIWAADNGAAISQNSWSYTSVGVYDQAVLDAIDYFNSNGGGSVMDGGITIFAAGNYDASGLWYPGCYSGTFAVAATNNQDIKSWYSNYDTWVDISAPGGETDVVNERGVLSTLLGNTYGFYQGTSMACPHVSGVAALILSLAPGQLTSAEVKTILESSTDDISALNPGYAGKLGTGRLNAYDALLLTQTYINPLIPLPPSNLQAIASSSTQINLSWMLNPDNDPVMLAFNTTNTFGTPSGNYANGAAITGGGTVIYQGSGTSFSHTVLNPDTKYYYALWSKDGAYYSAFPLVNSAKTLCGVVTPPYEQHFVTADFPNCWTQTSTISDRWTVSNTSNAGGAAYEMHAAWSTGTGVSRLIMPPINTNGLSSLALSFKHFFDDWGTGLNYKIQSSADGTTWTDEAWNNTSGSGNNSGTVNTTVVNNIGSVTYIAWVLEGNHYQFDAWDVDDVVVTVAATKALNLTVYPEGLYNGAGTLSKAQNESGDQFAGDIADQLTIELHSAADYNVVVYSSPSASLHTNGTVSISIPSTFSSSYYITIKHRNSIETTSASAISFAGSAISYAFNVPAKAYGSNLKLSTDGYGLIYCGEANGDHTVDISDMSEIDNDATAFTNGYVITDMNGDGVVDIGDMTLTDNNASNFVGSVLP
jgi:hypothetical protein